MNHLLLVSSEVELRTAVGVIGRCMFFSQILCGAKDKPWPKPLTFPLELAVTGIEAPKGFESDTEAISTQQKNIIFQQGIITRNTSTTLPFGFPMDK